MLENSCFGAWRLAITTEVMASKHVKRKIFNFRVPSAAKERQCLSSLKLAKPRLANPVFSNKFVVTGFLKRKHFASALAVHYIGAPSRESHDALGPPVVGGSHIRLKIHLAGFLKPISVYDPPAADDKLWGAKKCYAN